MVRYITFLIILLTTYQSLSQNQISNWYFGMYAGVNFDTEANELSILTDGELYTDEGCSSISDHNGNLLFYSDGKTVWDRDHFKMPNANHGQGLGLLGHNSSTTSIVILPKPKYSNLYYLFTTGSPNPTNNSSGLNYSLLDMSLQNGLGDVVASEKNIQLFTFDPSNPQHQKVKSSEKITFVEANDCSYWLISHFESNFYAFKVTENGINTTPVVSTVQPSVPVHEYSNNTGGYLKASPDGSKLAAAFIRFELPLNGTVARPPAIFLYNFNNVTGVVSNPQEIYTAPESTRPYGLEFSADNKKLYATILKRVFNGQPTTVSLLQWDLETDNITSSVRTIHEATGEGTGALQLGPDHKIYIARFAQIGLPSYLGVINNPEETGSNVNYDHFGVYLNPNGGAHWSRFGLPYLPPSMIPLFNQNIDIINNGLSTSNLELCEGETFTLEAEDIPNADYIWFKDNVEIPGETTPTLTVSSSGTYKVLIELNNGKCPTEGKAVVNYFDIPIITNQPSNLQVCSDSFSASFDFSEKDAEILDALNPDTYEVMYFSSIDDAFNGINPITGNFTNSTNPQTIVARVQNQGNPNCFDMTSFEVEVFITPIVNAVESLDICDDFNDPTDGIAQFDFNIFNNTVLGTQNAFDVLVSYHSTTEDAINNTNPITGNYQNITAFTDTVFVRLTNSINLNCFSTTSITLNVNPAPEAVNTTIFQCDEDGTPNGFTLFNINQIFEDITNGQPNRSIDYYLSESDLNNNINAIDGNNFANFENPQTIYALVTNTVTGCSSTAEVTLEVSATAANDAQLFACDDDGVEDGFYSFNLSQADPQVLQGLPTGLDIAYYETLEDALLENNQLPNNYINTIAFNHTIFVRVENDNACFGINEVELTVFELPQIETEFETLYCLNFFPETITLDGGVLNDLPNNFFYNWSNGETTTQIEVDAPGTYTVRVSNTNGCFKDRTITVLPSNIATVENVQVTDAAQDNSISVSVSGEGDYEYALDNFGPFQDSNTFNNLQPGIYTIFIRDRNNCGVVEETVSVIGFPKYFTPNGDGYNDFWQVKGINRDFQPNTVIYIYDRYGKLLAQINPLSSGWDGTFNGQPMPTNDYWFSVKLEDGRQLNGHFTLKR